MKYSGILLVAAMISMTNLLGCAHQERKNHRYSLTPGEVLKTAQPSDWRTPDRENLLHMKIKGQWVIIELKPEFAPEHVKNIKALTRGNYWKGLSVFRSQDNYVAQWGDYYSDDPKKRKPLPPNAQANLVAEFERPIGSWPTGFELEDGDVYSPSVGLHNGIPVGRDPKTQTQWPLHCYGMVGVSRGNDINSGSGTSLYAVTGHSPRHLDRNITVVGKVWQGMSLLTTLPRGAGPMGFYKSFKKATPIQEAFLASDRPQEQSKPFRVLRTDTPLFQKLVAARRNRKEAWFHRPSGAVEICNLSTKVEPLP